MPEAATNPVGESQPRTDWDIGKALNGFFPGAGEPELEAEASPDKGTEAEDEDVVEASGGEDAEPDEDEAPSEDPFTPLPLKVGGKEVVVESREEAIALAQKGMHYTQEMQKLRERETQLASEYEQRSQSVQQKVEQYSTALKTLSDVYGHVLGTEPPDWSSEEMQRLRKEKPDDYLAMREQWDQLGAIRSELSRIEQERQKESEKQFQSWLVQQREELAAKRPEWTDATRRQQDWNLIRDYATQQGITEQEIANLYDNRFWVILHDAARYRQAEATGKKAKPAASKTAEPGSGRGVNQGQRQFRQERDRLKQTGDVRAAGNIFQDIMTRKS